jgi:hypothetical protein
LLFFFSSYLVLLSTGQCCPSAGFCPKKLAWAEGTVSVRFREERFALCVKFRF